jgi:hypothetical protein
MSAGRDGDSQMEVQMALSTYAIGTTASLLLGAVAPHAAANVSEQSAQPVSVEQRVAAIRAKATELMSAQLPDAAAAWALGRPAEVAWNDWKNQ